MPLKHFLMRVTGALRWLIPVRVSARACLRGARHRDFRLQCRLALRRDAITRHAAGGRFDPALLHHVGQRFLAGGQQMGRGKFRHGAELLQRGALDVVREVGGACWHVGVMQLRGALRAQWRSYGSTAPAVSIWHNAAESGPFPKNPLLPGCRKIAARNRALCACWRVVSCGRLAAVAAARRQSPHKKWPGLRPAMIILAMGRQFQPFSRGVIFLENSSKVCSPRSISPLMKKVGVELTLSTSLANFWSAAILSSSA